MIRFVYSALFCMQPIKQPRHSFGDTLVLCMLRSGSYSLAEHTNSPSIACHSFEPCHPRGSSSWAGFSRSGRTGRGWWGPTQSRSEQCEDIHQLQTSTARAESLVMELRESEELLTVKEEKDTEEMRAESISRTLSEIFWSLDALLPHNADSQRLIWLWEKYSHRGSED